MATTAKTKAKTSGERRSRAKPGPVAGAADAIALLEADHRDVEDHFAKYETLRSRTEKKALADKICLALRVHTQIEEELFYPAAREATGDNDLLDEALVEHAGAKALVAEIEAMEPGQDLYDAKLTVLGEQIRHHAGEEEDELFPEVRKTKLDLQVLGRALRARKDELVASLAAKAR